MKTVQILAFVVASLAMLSSAYAASSAESIRWFDGAWDEAGAPKGKLLSDNPGWWGERVWTGVDYSYEEKPTNPHDYAGADAKTFGRRLLDGDAPTGWHRPVGMNAHKPIVVVFDFKRPCTFTEVDVVSTKSPVAAATLSASEDGTNWVLFAETACSNALSRIRPALPGKGRYLRVSYVSKSAAITWLDEVFVWGDGEVSEKYPDDSRPVEYEFKPPQSIRGNAKTRWEENNFAEYVAGSKSGIEIVEIGARPDEISRPIAGRTPEAFALRMARNETEARFFAVVNATREEKSVAISVEGFGDGVVAELLAGGVIRTNPNKRKMSEQEKFDRKIKGEIPEELFDARFDVLPFFGRDSWPSDALLARHVANADQIRGFPSAVPLKSGEAFVVMLRLKTDGAEPGERKGILVAGAASLPIAVEIVDLMLPDPPVWVFAWGVFTPQYPFESKTRFDRDVQSVVDLGVSQWRIPAKGSKGELALRKRPSSWFMSLVSDGQLFHDVYNQRVSELTDEHRKHLDESAARALAKADAVGIPHNRIVFDLPDEIGPGNSKVAGELAAYVKSKHPEVSIFCNPSFWTGKGFAKADLMLEKLGPWYNDFVDVSVPYRSHLEDKAKRDGLFTKPRCINAQYAHPAARAGRSIAWSSFRYGMNGYAWWCYYWPTGGTPWDIRTWRIYEYETKMALPLENGVAVCPAFEEMREAWEDWRILTALKEAGKTELLDSLLKEFGDSFDRPNMETARPYKCNFLKLRDKALGAFAK